ncbi:hypothetical protein PFISCL1PPCAC_2162, partial [Pristionchus fissidentatus]
QSVMIIILLLCTVAALYYFPWILKQLADWIHQYPMVKKLPGPKGLPLLGSVLDVAGDTTGDTSIHIPLNFFLKEAEKARAKGDQIMTVTIMGRTITFPLNGDMVKTIFESTEETMKGKDYDILGSWVGVEGILISIGQPWRDRRKQLTPMFHFSMLEGYLETFNKHTRVMMDVMREEAEIGEVDMMTVIKRCSLDIIVDTAMGADFCFQRDPSHPYVHAVDVFTKFCQRYMVEPQMWISWIWLLCYHREYKEALNDLHALTDRVLKERFKRVQTGEVDLEEKKKPLIDHFLVLHEQDKMTMKDVHYETNAIIFGGHDTTSASLSWIFWALATQPHFQQRCYEEIHEIFGESDRDCTHDDLKRMEFTERFIKETMRMFAPVPLVERELQKDFQMGDHILPRGTEIFINAFMLHHNEDSYKDSWKFDPDRFLPENNAKRHPYDYLPFSAGVRNCLGQKFAMQEMKVIISSALRNFSFATDGELLDQGYATEVVLKPTLGCNLRLTAR